MNISLLVLRCKDIEKSKNFYESLGLSFVMEKHGRGPEHFACELSGTVLELYPSEGEMTKDVSRLGFSVKNLPAVVKNISVQSTYEYAGSTIYVVIDPDGRKVEISAHTAES